MTSMPDLQGWIAAGPTAIHADKAPAWMAPFIRRFVDIDPATISHTDPPASGTSDRQAAVLILMGNDPDGRHAANARGRPVTS
jgi:hypothetical protein